MRVNGRMKTAYSTCAQSISLDAQDHEEYNGLCCMSVYMTYACGYL